MYGRRLASITAATCHRLVYTGLWLPLSTAGCSGRGSADSCHIGRKHVIEGSNVHRRRSWRQETNRISLLKPAEQYLGLYMWIQKPGSKSLLSSTRNFLHARSPHGSEDYDLCTLWTMISFWYNMNWAEPWVYVKIHAQNVHLVGNQLVDIISTAVWFPYSNCRREACTYLQSMNSIVAKSKFKHS